VPAPPFVHVDGCKAVGSVLDMVTTVRKLLIL
jgi:hypothetical protein